MSSTRRAAGLEHATIAWNVCEAVVAIAAGVAGASVALVAFGLDSGIEIVSATVVLVHLRALLSGRTPDARRERRSLRIIAGTFFALAAYVSVEVVVTLVGQDRPDTSPFGAAFAGVALVVMLVLARAKRRTARQLDADGHGPAAALLSADAAETALCALLSAATLLGLGAHLAFGWWWADPVASLVVVYFAVREGREAWEGELEHDAD